MAVKLGVPQAQVGATRRPRAGTMSVDEYGSVRREPVLVAP